MVLNRVKFMFSKNVWFQLRRRFYVCYKVKLSNFPLIVISITSHTIKSIVVLTG